MIASIASLKVTTLLPAITQKTFLVGCSTKLPFLRSELELAQGGFEWRRRPNGLLATAPCKSSFGNVKTLARK
jgi:hypothetical protein